MVDLIARKRDGGKLGYEDFRFIAQGAADRTIPDYQLSAWLMATYLRGLDEEETAWLTKAMAESGTRIDLGGLPKPWVDKHSTGGVGDKTTLVLLPILACCGLTVVKMSGRGLGITGGTIDKLSAIPGFRLDLTPSEMKDQAAKIGVALTGQSPNLAPADKTLYALRDVTATVGSIPLIVSSILSKKIAGGAETIVLDVKCGSGAFMTTIDQARELSRQLVRTGELLGLGVTASISDMEQPLGSTAGNALEVREAIQVLSDEVQSGPSLRFRELCLHYAGETLHAAGKAPSLEAGRDMAEQVLNTRAGLEKFKEWVRAQGGAPIWEGGNLPEAPVKLPMVHSGMPRFVAKIPALEVGQTVIDLGGGRKTKDDQIDLSVGVELDRSVGDRVSEGEAILTVHSLTQADARKAIEKLGKAIVLSEERVATPPLILSQL